MTSNFILNEKEEVVLQVCFCAIGLANQYDELKAPIKINYIGYVSNIRMLLFKY